MPLPAMASREERQGAGGCTAGRAESGTSVAGCQGGGGGWVGPGLGGTGQPARVAVTGGARVLVVGGTVVGGGVVVVVLVLGGGGAEVVGACVVVVPEATRTGWAGALPPVELKVAAPARLPIARIETAAPSARSNTGFIVADRRRLRPAAGKPDNWCWTRAIPPR